MRRPARIARVAVCLTSLLAPVPSNAVPAPTCVEPHIDVLGRVSLAAPDRLDFALIADLDGDRRRDLLLWDVDTCGSGGCDYHLYLTSRGCPRWAGWLRGGRPRPLPTRHAGVRDLTANENGGSLSWTESVAEHDGHGYRVRTRDCRQPAGAEPTCSDFRPRPP